MPRQSRETGTGKAPSAAKRPLRDQRKIRLDEAAELVPLTGDPVLATPVVRTELSTRAPACAADVMTENLTTAAPDADVVTLAAIMRDENVGILPIVDAHHRVLGVVTDRDIVIRVDASASPPAKLHAQDIMTVDLVTVRPEEDLHEVIDRMGEEGLHRVLVTDLDQHLRGIISVSDLARRTDLPERVQDMVDQISRHRA